MRKTILAITITPLIGYIADKAISLLFDSSFIKSILDFIVKALSIKVPIWFVLVFLPIVIAILFFAFLNIKQKRALYVKEYTTDQYSHWTWIWSYQHDKHAKNGYTIIDLEPTCACGGHLAENDHQLICPLCNKTYPATSQNDYKNARAYIKSRIDANYTNEPMRRKINSCLRGVKDVSTFSSANRVFSDLNNLYHQLSQDDKVQILINTVECNDNAVDPEYSNQIFASLSSNTAVRAVLKRAYKDAKKKLPTKYKRIYKHGHPSIDHNDDFIGLSIEQAILK